MNDADKAPDTESEKPVTVSEAAPTTSEHEYFQPHALPGSKTKKSKMKWIVPLIFVLIIGLGVGAYFVIANYTKPKAATETTGYENAPHFSSADKLITDVKPNLQGQPVAIVSSDGYGGKTVDGFGAYSVPPYKVGDRKFANLPGSSSGASYQGSSVDAAKNYDALTSYFKKNNFKQLNSGEKTTAINQWFSGELQYISYASYESSSQLCMIWHVDATPTSIKNHVTSVGCADKSSYESAAKELDQFYTAYAKESKASNAQVVLGMPYGSDGSDNYSNVVVYQEDSDQLGTPFQGLYYKTADAKEWTYFTGAYGLLSCTEYNTDVLKKAFKGFSCYNDAAKTYGTVI